LALTVLVGLLLGVPLVESILLSFPSDRRQPYLLWLSPLPRWNLALDQAFSGLLVSMIFGWPLLLAAIVNYPTHIWPYWVLLIPVWLGFWLRGRAAPFLALLATALSVAAGYTLAVVASGYLASPLPLLAGEEVSQVAVHQVVGSLGGWVVTFENFLTPLGIVLTAPWYVHLPLALVLVHLTLRAAEASAFAAIRPKRPAFHLSLPANAPLFVRLALLELRRPEVAGTFAGFVLGISLGLYHLDRVTLEAAWWLGIWGTALAVWGPIFRLSIPLEEGIFVLKPNPKSWQQQLWRGRVAGFIFTTLPVLRFPRLLSWALPAWAYLILLAHLSPRLGPFWTGVLLSGTLSGWLLFALLAMGGWRG